MKIFASHVPYVVLVLRLYKEVLKRIGGWINKPLQNYVMEYYITVIKNGTEGIAQW